MNPSKEGTTNYFLISLYRLTQLSVSKDEFITEVERPQLGMLDILVKFSSI